MKNPSLVFAFFAKPTTPHVLNVINRSQRDYATNVSPPNIGMPIFEIISPEDIASAFVDLQDPELETFNASDVTITYEMVTGGYKLRKNDRFYNQAVNVTQDLVQLTSAYASSEAETKINFKDNPSAYVGDSQTSHIFGNHMISLSAKESQKFVLRQSSAFLVKFADCLSTSRHTSIIPSNVLILLAAVVKGFLNRGISVIPALLDLNPLDGGGESAKSHALKFEIIQSLFLALRITDYKRGVAEVIEEEVEASRPSKSNDWEVDNGGDIVWGEHEVDKSPTLIELERIREGGEPKALILIVDEEGGVDFTCVYHVITGRYSVLSGFSAIDFETSDSLVTALAKDIYSHLVSFEDLPEISKDLRRKKCRHVIIPLLMGTELEHHVLEFLELLTTLKLPTHSPNYQLKILMAAQSLCGIGSGFNTELYAYTFMQSLNMLGNAHRFPVKK